MSCGPPSEQLRRPHWYRAAVPRSGQLLPPLCQRRNLAAGRSLRRLVSADGTPGVNRRPYPHPEPWWHLSVSHRLRHLPCRMHEVIRSDSDEQVARRHDRSWLKQAQGRGAGASRQCTLARVSGLSDQRHLSATSIAENGIINKNASTRRQAHGRDYSAIWFGVVVFVSFMRTSTEHVAFCWLVRHDYG